MCLYVNRVFYTFISIHFSSHLIEPSVFNGESGYSSVCLTVLRKIDFVKLTGMRVCVRRGVSLGGVGRRRAMGCDSMG